MFAAAVVLLTAFAVVERRVASQPSRAVPHVPVSLGERCKCGHAPRGRGLLFDVVLPVALYAKRPRLQCFAGRARLFANGSERDRRSADQLAGSGEESEHAHCCSAGTAIAPPGSPGSRRSTLTVPTLVTSLPRLHHCPCLGPALHAARFGGHCRRAAIGSRAGLWRAQHIPTGGRVARAWRRWPRRYGSAPTCWPQAERVGAVASYGAARCVCVRRRRPPLGGCPRMLSRSPRGPGRSGSGRGSRCARPPAASAGAPTSRGPGEG